jgi:hypothetical protein
MSATPAARATTRPFTSPPQIPESNNKGPWLSHTLFARPRKAAQTIAIFQLRKPPDPSSLRPTGWDLRGRQAIRFSRPRSVNFTGRLDRIRRGQGRVATTPVLPKPAWQKPIPPLGWLTAVRRNRMMRETRTPSSSVNLALADFLGRCRSLAMMPNSALARSPGPPSRGSTRTRKVARATRRSVVAHLFHRDRGFGAEQRGAAARAVSGHVVNAQSA